MNLAVIVLNFNTKEYLKQCLKSVLNKKEKADVQIIVVDNNSSDGSIEMVKENFPKVDIMANKKNLGYSAGNNVALKKIKSSYYLLLNSDTLIKEGSIADLVDFMEKNNFGIATCELVFPNGKFQPNAGDLPFGVSLISWLSGLDDFLHKIGLKVPSFHQNQRFYYDGVEVGWVSGAAMAIKDDVIKKIGYLDENIFMYGEDTEYCIRAKRAGFKIGWTDQVKIVHIAGASSSDPKFRQRLGEFKGIKYIYRKYFGETGEYIVTCLIYFFVFLRALTFFITGRINQSITYAKVLFSI